MALRLMKVKAFNKSLHDQTKTDSGVT